MEQNQADLIRKYVDVLLRRKKLIISFFLLSFVVGLGVYLKTPKVYQANALIMYQREKVNPTKMSPDVTDHMKEMVATVTQQITSRTSLEELIKQFKLYQGLQQTMPMEDVVALMREQHVTIKMEQGDTLRVAYQGADPKTVTLVANALSSKFIEENLRVREARATETSEYIKDELRMAKEVLDKKEGLMRDYKLQYYNELPEQLQTNVTRLNALQTQNQSAQTHLEELERTKVMIQEQISIRRERFDQARAAAAQAAATAQTVAALQQQAEQTAAGQVGRQPSPGAQDITRLRAELERLLSIYTEKHPDVRRLQKNIAALEEKESSAVPEVVPQTLQQKSSQTNSPTEMPLLGRSAQEVAEIAPLEAQLVGIDMDTKRIKQEREELRREIERYQAWVEKVPVREAEWTALTRDYNELRKNYEGLMSSSLHAESAETLERRQKGSQFKVVDPARFPEKPFKPDFKKIMLLAVALGLGVGGGISFLLEIFDTSFREATDLTAFLNLPVLCSLPVVSSAQLRKKEKLMSILWGSALALSLLTIVALFAICWKKGMIII